MSRYHSNQRRMDFGGSDHDAAVEFRQKMSALREKLKSVAPAAVGLSSLRWEQVRELIMAIMSYMLAGRQPELAGMLRTSGLTRDQWYVARENALALGLITASRRYTSRARRVDQLAVDQLAVDQLARGPTNTDQHRIGPTKSDQVRPSPTSIKEDTARAMKKPKNLRTSSTTTRAELRAKRRRRLAKTIRVVEEEVASIGVDCRKISEAVRHAVRVGKATRQELIERVAWFGQRLEHYAREHRGGALYVGIHDAKHGLVVHQGWPHSENFLEHEARRVRDRKQQQLRAEQDRAAKRAVQESFERSRQREKEFGAVLNALSDNELEALELQCFHAAEFAKKIRGNTAYRDTLLAALANRAEKGAPS